MRIGLLGFGVVGEGFYELTQKRTDCDVVKVLCRKERSGIPQTYDFADILNDKTIDTVVEVMGGLHPAYEYVKAALEAGKNVITANKALIAAYYDVLIPLANENGVKLRCTAAVGGGIGWLSGLERARRVQSVTMVQGIMNGTCNYILDSMTRLGLGYEEALLQAQQLGYAEADPSADVDGIDTWNKLIISCNIAFGICLESVPVAGIRRITASDVAEFTKAGFVCKLLATGIHHGASYSAYVQPTLVPMNAPEAAVPSNYNHISFQGETSGKMSFFGQGAGRYPTAYNVMQDCVDVMDGKGFYAPCGAPAKAANTEKFRYYVRGSSDRWLAEHTTKTCGGAVITEPVSVSQMHSWLSSHPEAFIAAIAE